MSMPTSGIVSLKADYNAVGDGSADDSQSVRNFFEYLADNGGTGIIEPGTYLTSAYTRNGRARPFTVIGGGPNVSILKNKSAGNFLTWINCSNIHIKSVRLDCSYTLYPPTGNNYKHGFKFSSCHNCSVEDSSVYDFVGTGFMAMQESASSSRPDNIIFKNCVAQASKAFIDWAAASTTELKRKKECVGMLLVDCDYSAIQDCTAIDMSLYGIELKNNAKWNKVLHNKAITCVYGFGMGQQTTGDIGCEHNIVEGFQAKGCFMGGILGKAKYNLMSDFRVDFTGMNTNNVRNAFRFQLNSRFNSLDNILISGMPAGKIAILYETGSNNNISAISFCEKNSGNSDILVASYNHTAPTATETYTDTVNNYTLLYRSNTPRNKLKVAGDAVSSNKSRYLWDNSNIVASDVSG
ncbi:right-handed parallel beta-helix repeat-containing protein [Pseudescherichia sp.]|uniref:right-handed parallel beta-helix repeat-containing protein n=1 Tax=Pseudescherichia sp. TaxID=2055881 RepID=UPI00289E1F3F|nr:right-handed parallel beta-helix repeat-containing protein [Pseudescherichia sp.]